jgi:tetratricopeptide (TPR) repeat protein
MKIVYVFCALLLQISILSNSQDLNTAKNLTLSQRFEDATDLFKKLLTAEPNNSDIYYYYGQNILDEYINDPFSNSRADAAREASDLFKEGIKIDSLNPLNHIGLGMIAVFQKKDTTLANTYYTRAEKTLPKKVKNYTPKNIETLVKLSTAELYAENPRFQKALNWAEMAKLAAPNNPDVFIALGDIYITNTQPSLAITNYNRALYLDPQNVLLLTKIGNIYIRARNLTESRNYFEKAKAIDSTFAPLYKGLGEAYSMAGRHDFAKQNYKKFLALSGDNVPAKVSYIGSLFKAKDYKETLVQIEEVQKIDNSRNYLNRIGAYSAYEKKPADHKLALQYIEKFFENTPLEKIITRDYAYYGRILLKLKQDTTQTIKGIEMLQKAYQMDTTDMDIVDELATAAYYNNEYPVAVEMLNKKIAAGNATTNDFMYLGKTYYKMKEYGKADTVFTGITQKEPDYLQAYVWMANTYASLDPESKEGLAKPKYEMVIQKALVDTVKNATELFDSYSYMGSYYLFSPKPDLDNSEYYYHKIINLDPSNKKWQIKAYKSLGIIYTKRKNYPQAILNYKKVLALDPNDPDSTKAIEGLNKAIEAQKQQ